VIGFSTYCRLWTNTEFTKQEAIIISSGVPREFYSGGGVSTNSVEDRGQRERGSGGSGGSCNLVHEISFNIVKFS